MLFDFVSQTSEDNDSYPPFLLQLNGSQHAFPDSMEEAVSMPQPSFGVSQVRY